MKLTINKLIANDIINYAMDKIGDGFNYIVGIGEYLEEYDEESQKYIKDNLDEIKDDISASERVSYIECIDDNEIDLTFYWGYLLDSMETHVMETAIKNNIDLSFEAVKNIANDMVDNDEFNNNLIDKIKLGKDEDYEL